MNLCKLSLNNYFKDSTKISNIVNRHECFFLFKECMLQPMILRQNGW